MLRKCVFPLVFVAGLFLVVSLPVKGAPTRVRSVDQIGSGSIPGKMDGTLDPWGGRGSSPRKRGGSIGTLGFLGSATEGEAGSQIDPNGNRSSIRMEVDPNG